MNVLNSLSSWLLTCGPDALPRALTLLAQATLPLTVGLLVRHALRRRGPAARLLLANGTLFAVFAVAILSFGLAGRYRALWTFALPSPTPIGSTASAALPHLSELTPLLSPRPAPADLPLYPAPVNPVNPARVNPEPEGQARTQSSVHTAAVPVAAIGQPERHDPESSPSIVGSSGHLKSLDGGLIRIAARLTHGPAFAGEWVSKRLSGAAWYALLCAVWCVGTLLLLVWLGLSCFAIACLRRRCQPVQDEHVLAMLFERSAALHVVPPQLLVSDRARGPFLTGLLRPAIVLPAGYQTDFAQEELRAVLTHELAHLAQHDGWWTLLARLLCAVCWPHPLLWLLCRERAEAGEEACDLVVLAQGCSGPAYARCLLALAERLRPPHVQRAATLGMIGSRSALSRRIEQILHGLRQLPPALSIRVKLPIFVLIPALVCAALYFVGLSHRERRHALVVTQAFIPHPDRDADRLRIAVLEVACAAARQQLAAAEAQAARTQSVLQQIAVRYNQLRAQHGQMQAEVATNEACLATIHAKSETFRREIDNYQSVMSRQKVDATWAGTFMDRAVRDNATRVSREDMRNQIPHIFAALQSTEAERAPAQATLARSRSLLATFTELVAHQQIGVAQLQQQLMAAQAAVAVAQQRLMVAQMELHAEQMRHQLPVDWGSIVVRSTVDFNLPAMRARLEADREAKRARHFSDIAAQLQQRVQTLEVQQNKERAVADQLAAKQRQNAKLPPFDVQMAQQSGNLPAVASRQEPSREEMYALEGQLIDAETRLDKLRSIYTDNHPRLKSAQEWVNQLSTRLKQLMAAAAPYVQYDIIGMELNELQPRRADAMDHLVDLKYKYTSTNPKVRMAQQWLDDLDAQMHSLQQKHDRLYAEMKANPAPAGATLAIKRSLFHFAGDPPTTGQLIYEMVTQRKLPGDAGSSRVVSPNREGEFAQWETRVSGFTGKTLETQLLRISDYYDRDGHLLSSDTRSVYNQVYEVGFGAMVFHSGTEPAKLTDTPAGTTTVKYHYELHLKIRNENGPHASATQSSAVHTIAMNSRNKSPEIGLYY